MSESITLGSVHQKRSVWAQTLRNARASCRESRFEGKKEIGGPSSGCISSPLARMILPSIPELRSSRIRRILRMNYLGYRILIKAIQNAGVSGAKLS